MTSANKNQHKEGPSKDKFIDLREEYAQALVSALTSSKVLKSVPVVKTLAALVTAVTSVTDKLLIRKLGLFPGQLADVSAHDRQAMVDKLRTDRNYGEHVGEHMIELLDRVEGRRKPAMIGAAFAAFANHEIDSYMLSRLNCAIERLPVLDIEVARSLLGAPSDLPLLLATNQASSIFRGRPPLRPLALALLRFAADADPPVTNPSRALRYAATLTLGRPPRLPFSREAFALIELRLEPPSLPISCIHRREPKAPSMSPGTYGWPIRP